jgi:uncharacterized protein (DUF1330 family)
MSACVIGHISVRDEAKWAQYRAQVPATLAPWGAELLFRGNLSSVLNGQHPHTDTVIIRFPDQAAVDGWYQSTAYQALIPLRQQAADLDLLSFTD